MVSILWTCSLDNTVTTWPYQSPQWLFSLCLDPFSSRLSIPWMLSRFKPTYLHSLSRVPKIECTLATNMSTCLLHPDFSCFGGILGANLPPGNFSRVSLTWMLSKCQCVWLPCNMIYSLTFNLQVTMAV